MPSTERRTTLATALLCVCLLLSACGGGGSSSKDHTMDTKQFRADAITAVKQIVAATGMKLTSANYSLANCYDDSNGNAWRALVTGNYDSGSTLAQSQQTVARWAAGLKRHGWAHQPGTITHSGLVTSRAGGSVELSYQDASFKNQPPPFTYNGPCHPLPKGQDDSSDLPDVSSILSEIHEP